MPNPAAGTAPDVRLHIGGLAHGGWTAIDINRTLEAVAGSFSFRVTERWPGRQDVAAVKPGEACSVSIDGITVITGFVDELGVSYDKDSHELSVKGRDRTGDLVDCSAVEPPGPYIGQTLLQIASALCAPFGIPVKSTVDLSRPFPNVNIQTGETVFELIDRHARLRAALPVSDGLGGLLFTRAGAAGTNSALILGKNILQAEGSYSHRERFSRYLVLSQSAGGDLIAPEIAAGALVGRASDPAIGRFRPLVVLSEAIGLGSELQDRARWEASVRAGRSRRAAITVNGWRDGAGALWQPNRMVRVEDDYLALHGAMLISGVRLTLDENGARAALTVTWREAFELLALPPEYDFDPRAGRAAGGRR